MSKVTVIVPAYNPERPFAELVRELTAEFDVLVVNDGSKSGCAPLFKEAEEAGATVLKHDVNRGKGAAIKTAIRSLQAGGGDWVAVTADADGQHRFEDIKKVALLAEGDPDCLVLGVRDFKRMPARSRFGNSLTRASFALATGTHISDTQTGLRGFSSRTADKLLTAAGDRYEYEMNVLINLKKWGIPVKETTIETVYIDGNASSHFHPIRDSLIVYGQIIKHTTASLICTALDYALYLLLIMLTPIQPGWAYLGARMVSASVNYQLSRRLVFHAAPSWRTTAAYFLLAICTVCTGSLLVMLFTVVLHAGEVWIKLPIDVFLFFVNYFLQKRLVFYEK